MPRPPDPSAPGASTASAASDEGPFLTAAGRAMIEERVRELERSRRELDDVIREADDGADAVEAHQRATTELTRLQTLLRDARPADEIEDDPGTVDLGDTVEIRLEDQSVERYVLVSAAEASMDDQRISVESPLGRALLGRRVGDDVTVEVPAGSYRCTILCATRDDA